MLVLKSTFALLTCGRAFRESSMREAQLGQSSPEIESV